VRSPSLGRGWAACGWSWSSARCSYSGVATIASRPRPSVPHFLIVCKRSESPVRIGAQTIIFCMLCVYRPSGPWLARSCALPRAIASKHRGASSSLSPIPKPRRQQPQVPIRAAQLRRRRPHRQRGQRSRSARRRRSPSLSKGRLPPPFLFFLHRSLSGPFSNGLLPPSVTVPQ